MNQTTAAQILDFMEKYDKHYKELRTFIDLKQEKVAGDDLVWLLDSLNEEQKLVMQGNSLETKRQTMFEEAGVGNCNATQLIEKCPEEIKGRMRIAVDSIASAVNYIKDTNKDILEMARRKLEIQAKVLKNDMIAGSDTYTNTGAKSKKMGGDNIIGSV